MKREKEESERGTAKFENNSKQTLTLSVAKHSQSSTSYLSSPRTHTRMTRFCLVPVPPQYCFLPSSSTLAGRRPKGPEPRTDLSQITSEEQMWNYSFSRAFFPKFISLLHVFCQMCKYSFSRAFFPKFIYLLHVFCQMRKYSRAFSPSKVHFSATRIRQMWKYSRAFPPPKFISLLHFY